MNEVPVEVPVGPRLLTVDDLLMRILGKWCSRCRRVTQPYISDKNDWPCCDGCWRVYPDRVGEGSLQEDPKEDPE